MIVLRSTYDRERDARDRAEEERDWWRMNAKAWADVVDRRDWALRDLTERLLALKRDGFVTPPEKRTEPVVRMDQRVESAIRDSTERASREEADARAYAASHLAGLSQGTEEYEATVESVCQRIRRGGE